MIKWLRQQWKPWSIVIVGQESGRISPPLRWLRWQTRAGAEQWIASMTSSPGSVGLTAYRAVDLRERR